MMTKVDGVPGYEGRSVRTRSAVHDAFNVARFWHVRAMKSERRSRLWFCVGVCCGALVAVAGFALGLT